MGYRVSWKTGETIPGASMPFTSGRVSRQRQPAEGRQGPRGFNALHFGLSIATAEDGEWFGNWGNKPQKVSMPFTSG